MNEIRDMLVGTIAEDKRCQRDDVAKAKQRQEEEHAQYVKEQEEKKVQDAHKQGDIGEPSEKKKWVGDLVVRLGRILLLLF